MEGLKFWATAQNEADAKVLAAASTRSCNFIELSKLKTPARLEKDASDARLRKPVLTVVAGSTRRTEPIPP